MTRLFGVAESIPGQLCFDDQEPARKPLELKYNRDTVVLPLDEFEGRQRMNGRCRKCRAKRSMLAPTTRGYNGGQVPCARIVGGRNDGLLTTIPTVFLRCECGEWIHMRRVQGNVVPDIRCDARCMNATGYKCDCQCGGMNHGASHEPLG